MRERGVDGRIEGSKMVSYAPLMISKERSRRRRHRKIGGVLCMHWPCARASAVGWTKANTPLP